MQTEKYLTGYPSIDKPWLKYYSEEAINAKLPEYTMYEYIYHENQHNLNHVAINWYGSNITYGEMFKIIDHMAGVLENEGVKEGDTVTICMINAPETMFLILACNKIGAVANMVYGTSAPEELMNNITVTNSSLVFTVDMFQDKFLQIVNESHIKKVIVANLTQSMSWINRVGARLLKGIKPQKLPNHPLFISWAVFFADDKTLSFHTCHNPDAPAMITYTGGTTGGSKGVLLSNKAINSISQQYILSEGKLSKTSVWLHVLPLFIAYGVTCSMMIFLSAGITGIIRLPMAESIATLYKKFKPNYIIYGPAFWEKFADDNQKIDLSHLKATLCGGDTLRPSVEKKINNYLKRRGSPVPLLNGYAMTETGAGATLSYAKAYKIGSVGIPLLKVTVSAFDPDTGKELPYNQEGEICIHAPSMMLGYISNESETNKLIRRHDDEKLWVHSGDLGHIDEDGFVYISGRLKRYMLCIANGIQKKVFSLDIERVLLKHPAVDNCAVVPIPDEQINQAPVAYVVLNKKYEKSSSTITDLEQYCKENLESIYRPVKYKFIKEFPLTKIGKIDYMALEKTAAELKEDE